MDASGPIGRRSGGTDGGPARPTQQRPVVGRGLADAEPGIRNPSQWSVSTRDSDGGTGLSQDDSRTVEPFLGATVHVPSRTVYCNGAVRRVKHFTIVHLRMVRVLNGGSGAEAADRAFQPCVKMMLLRRMELEL